MSSVLCVENYDNIDDLYKMGKDYRGKYVFNTSVHDESIDLKVLMEELDLLEISSGKCIEKAKTIMYADGIPVYGTSFNITSNFSLSNLGTLLDVVQRERKCITQPKLYGGLEYSTFAWHTEDDELFTANYLHYGAPCLW